MTTPNTTDTPELPLHEKKELAKSKISSKGQITLPIEIRERLGVKEGESIKFVADKDGRTVVLPVREKVDVFAQFIGIAPLPPEYEDSVAWVRDMRDDDYEAEQTRLRREAAKKAKQIAA
jgi:AbrB family looped-hinge helix DNA binding protein